MTSARLPVPVDDGAANHLDGAILPSLGLTATSGETVDIGRTSGRVVVYVYPMTARPDTALPDDWDAIPGARGCTPHGDVRYDQPGSMAPDQHAELAFVPAECDGDECGTVGYIRRHAGRVLLVCGDQLPDPQPPAPPAPAWVKRFRRHPQVDGTWVRILEDGTLEMRDPNDGQSSDPARKCRHQYIVDDETGDLLYRRLPPATVGDEWADLGLPPWEYRDPYGSSYGGVVLDYWEMRVL